MNCEMESYNERSAILDQEANPLSNKYEEYGRKTHVS